MASPLSWSFTIGAEDTVSPTVVSMIPANGDQNVLTNSSIKVTFSEAMDPTIVTFTLLQGTTAVPYTITYNDSLTVATIIPAAPLTSNTMYTATIYGTDLEDLAAAATTWSFTTGQ